MQKLQLKENFFFFQKRFDTKIKLSVKLMAKGYAGFPQTSKM